MKCPFCGTEMKMEGKLGELASKMPLVGGFIPNEVKNVEVFRCPKCGFIAFFARE
ncbi:hypothetical protein EYM_01590 [Ignicoccus islandicus DSM 13165]|uniref:Uncharacterized protein n=1 Tax=Ignicoccus islandicus DSM 13165 TaxID=940295 RepID=A0A0U3FPL0_9CREN|nr:hypothetical protein [Ignicoccus islandicus]ALU12223.1 hypothetical protein EYM_01590 [Ignicoccus islandicus DSM 13165]